MLRNISSSQTFGCTLVTALPTDIRSQPYMICQLLGKIEDVVLGQAASQSMPASQSVPWDVHALSQVHIGAHTHTNSPTYKSNNYFEYVKQNSPTSKIYIILKNIFTEIPSNLHPMQTSLKVTKYYVVQKVNVIKLSPLIDATYV